MESKVCKKCNINKPLSKYGKERNVCYKCRNVSCVDWKNKNINYFKEYNKAYYAINKDKIGKRRKQWALENKERYEVSKKKYQLKIRESLSDSYVINVIKHLNKNNISNQEIRQIPYLIEAKREIIKLNRKTKNYARK